MSESQGQRFAALSDYLRVRREAILLAWSKAVNADPVQTTARSLTRGQFHDHIPEALDAFQRKLCSHPGGRESQAADLEKARQEVKHGLHRWQQGYRLPEVLHEWGHLQLCLYEELEVFAATHPGFERETLVEANRQLINFINEAISESATQYARMQQAEAAGHIRDLDTALTAVKEIERHRATLIHQAVHDLRANVQSITSATDVLGDAALAEEERSEFANLIHQGVQSVSGMLGGLIELARLEAGQEHIEITAFDAAALAIELGNLHRPLAHEHGLFLKTEGPPQLPVESDSGKVRRLLQNLLINALKYTSQGGVIVSWGEEKENWWLMVKDTGPGILTGAAAPLATGMKEATASARESDEKAAAREGETSQVLAPLPSSPRATTSYNQPTGEGSDFRL